MSPKSIGWTLLVLPVLVAPEEAQGRQPISPGHIRPNPAWTADSGEPGGQFGISCSSAGDVNGDGFADVIVGAWAFDVHWLNEGRAFAYYGSASGLADSPSWTVDGNQSGALFGRSVSTAGDVNGDGFDDVIVGAYWWDAGEADEGRASVFLGSPAGLGASPTWTADGNQVDAIFGWSVSTAGDVNGDGFDDVIVGAPFFDGDQLGEGRTFLYLGSPVGPSSSPAWTADGNQVDAIFGWSVSTAGDVNGDGFDDVIVGAHGYENGQAGEGRALLYLGSPSGLVTFPSWSAESDQDLAAFGSHVASADDLNGDGFDDVAIVAVGFHNGDGRVYVFLGSATGLASSPSWTFETNQSGAGIECAASAGDVNHDGYGDLIVGSPAYSSHGRAFIFLGAATGLSTSPASTVETNQFGANFGYSACTARDVDGNHYDDVLIGAPLYNNGEEAEGQVFVFSWSARIQPASTPR